MTILPQILALYQYLVSVWLFCCWTCCNMRATLSSAILLTTSHTNLCSVPIPDSCLALPLAPTLQLLLDLLQKEGNVVKRSLVDYFTHDSTLKVDRTEVRREGDACLCTCLRQGTSLQPESGRLKMATAGLLQLPHMPVAFAPTRAHSSRRSAANSRRSCSCVSIFQQCLVFVPCPAPLSRRSAASSGRRCRRRS